MKKKGAIDIGNSRIKAGIFDEKGQLNAVDFFNELSSALQWLEKQGVSDAMVSDVKGTDGLTDTSLRVRYIKQEMKLPFKNMYKTPETLGADRIAVMAAATSLFPGKASMVFDIGTCITIDFLTPENEYFGGNISPGINMRLKAMAEFTNKLPLSTIEKSNFAMGHDTLSALANGAICGILHEIEGYIVEIKKQYPDANIILCGGDAHYFEKQLKYRIFADQNLVLLGLYHLSVLND